jgi:hypothetical protein
MVKRELKAIALLLSLAVVGAMLWPFFSRADMAQGGDADVGLGIIATTTTPGAIDPDPGNGNGNGNGNGTPGNGNGNGDGNGTPGNGNGNGDGNGTPGNGNGNGDGNGTPGNGNGNGNGDGNGTPGSGNGNGNDNGTPGNGNGDTAAPAPPPTGGDEPSAPAATVPQPAPAPTVGEPAPAVFIPQWVLAGLGDAVATVEYEVLPGAADLEVADGVIELAVGVLEVVDGDEVVASLDGWAVVTVQLGAALPREIRDEGLNLHRVVAVMECGTPVGGNLDRNTGAFTFETELTGAFTIKYVESLTRIIVAMGDTFAFCMAGNAVSQVMDVPPRVTADGVAVLPLRAMGYLLGADVFWDAQTDAITLTVDGASFSFIIGQADSFRIANRTMVPARAIAEFFGARVNWHPATAEIEIIALN